MTEKAKLVIIGAGIAGASTAVELVKLGWTDIILLDKGSMSENDGSSSHAPGGVGAINHGKLMTDFAQYASKMYSELDNFPHKSHLYSDPNFNQARNTYNPVGGIELARTKERWEDMKRLHSASKSFDVETHLMTAREVRDQLWPEINENAFTGALYCPTSALVSGAGTCNALIKKAVDSGGVRTMANTGVVDVEVVNGRVKAVITDNPDCPRIECEMALLATNIWSPVLGDKLGVDIPLLAFEHQYAVSEPIEELAKFDPNNAEHEAVYPLIRDLDVTMYYRNHWNKWGVGSYYHKPLPVNPHNVGRTAINDWTPEDFVDARLLATEMIPSLEGKEMPTKFNGMFSFSVDGYPVLGESKTKGLWVACAIWITHAGGVAKSLAEWMTYGEAEWDMRGCDVNRFHSHQSTRYFIDQIANCNYAEVYDIVHPRKPSTVPRNVRSTPLEARNKNLSGEFITFAGLEVANWYEENSRLLEKYEEQIPERKGWSGEFWSPIAAAEHLEVRANVGMYDLTGLSVIEVKGKGAADYIQYLCSNDMNKPVGSVIYTCWLTPNGGVKRDLAVSRMAKESYWMYVGEGTLPQDMAWVEKHAPNDGSVVVTNISDLYGCIGVFGPNARKVMQKVTDDDMSNEGFDYYGGKWIEIGPARVYAMRISYVGELGWELHIPYNQTLGTWDTLWEAGREFEMIAAGQASMDTLRVEKGYRLWGADVYTEYDPYQAGLGWTVRLKKGDFIGRDACVEKKAAGLKKKLACIVFDHPDAAAFGYEPVFDGDKKLGFITTANYGYTVGKWIAFAYIPKAFAVIGNEVEIEYFNQRFKATVVKDPIYDPKNEKVKA